MKNVFELADKFTIGVNQVFTRFKTNYLVRKEKQFVKEALASGIPLIVSMYNCGVPEYGLNPEADYVFDHEPNGGLDLSVIEEGEKIVVSSSSITSAMHIAAVMGAKNIILCGHDCGTLDNKSHFAEYNEAINGDEWYRNWIKMIENDTILVRDKLREVYGCHTYSLNPFINFGLEGHEYA